MLAQLPPIFRGRWPLGVAGTVAWYLTCCVQLSDDGTSGLIAGGGRWVDFGASISASRILKGGIWLRGIHALQLEMTLLTTHGGQPTR
jgi:hypothetical protein